MLFALVAVTVNYSATSYRASAGSVLADLPVSIIPTYAGDILGMVSTILPVVVKANPGVPPVLSPDRMRCQKTASRMCITRMITGYEALPDQY